MILLKESDVKKLAPKDQQYLVADIDGLYLQIFPSGTKTWVLRLSYGGKRKKFTLGKWPVMSLRDARAVASARRSEIEAISHSHGAIDAATFGAIAAEWRRVTASSLSDKTIQKIDSLLKGRVLPGFDKRFAATITPAEILARVRSVEAEGKFETAHKVLSVFRRIFDFGIQSGSFPNNPAANISGALVPVKTEHFSRLTDPAEVGALMRAIREYSHVSVRNAMLFSAYTFCRPGEIRMAEWREIDLSSAVWRIPEEKMKMRRPHIVPLSRQAAEVLAQQKAFLEEKLGFLPGFVFPAARNSRLPMSADTVRIALRLLGYTTEEMTAHGFRGMASTILNESGRWSPDAIERQLAHVSGNAVRAAYNYAEYLPERMKMMQWYADELDRLCNCAILAN